MNRQARLVNSSEWKDFGNVTLKVAAIQAAELAGLSYDKPIEVVARDAEDKHEHTMTVQAVRSYIVR